MKKKSGDEAKAPVITVAEQQQQYDTRGCVSTKMSAYIPIAVCFVFTLERAVAPRRAP